MSTFIPYGRQSINDDDIEAVTSVLRSDFLTQGPVIEQFEKAFASYCGAKYAVAVCNGTAALHVAALSADLKAGDILWTTPNTFVASANAGRYCGAEIDFVDIEDNYYNLCPERFEEKLRSAKKADKLPKVVVVVHFSGQASHLEKISELARSYGVKIIEDASHSMGARYGNQAVGSCEYSLMTTFSLHPVKIITSGEGGIITTNCDEHYERLKLFRCHGISRDEKLFMNSPPGGWYYEQQLLGFNYRITDIQAALGLNQLKKLDAFVSSRRSLAKRYDDALSELPLKLPAEYPGGLSSYHLYVIRAEKLRKKIYDYLKTHDIGVNVHYFPVHLQPYYQNLGFRPGDFPIAEKYADEALTLPLFPLLSEEQQNRVMSTLALAIKA